MASISSGTRFGPYEVIGLLGAGGMGEVYRARDTRLDRTVALKVLPQRATNTTQARERFEREARAISALNHPNICTLYDVGSHDGNEYLVMELIDGESLAERVARGSLPVDEVLRIGEAIAGALAKAHRAGIIHRDLKPGNIMLTKSGPKLLDFGLARKAEESRAHDATTMVGQPITTEGTILGTLPYMAPEQLEGKAADARTDLFALGAVLYELITGKRAFHAESQASLITKIMSVQPPAIHELQPLAPATLDRVVMKCLAKDPDDRWQAAADVATALQWVAEGVAAPAAGAKRKRMSFIPWAIAVLFAILALLALRRPVAATRTVRFGVDPPAHARFETNATWHNIAVSPDGKRIAFLARDTPRRLWLYDIASGESKVLEGTEAATSPFWSPDGKVLGFGARGKLKALNLDENRIQDICDANAAAFAATWLADGTIVYYELMSGAINAVAGAGGTPRKLFGIPKGSADIVTPSAIGRTRHFFFNTLDVNKTALWVGDIDGGQPRKLLEEAGRALYDAPYVTFVRDGTLYAQRFNERKLALEGSAVPLAEGVWFYKPLGQSLHAAAGDTIAYTPSTFIRALRWIDRSGHDLGEALPPGFYRNQIRLSPDGRALAAVIEDPHTFMGDVWTADLRRQSPNRLTFGDHDYDTPVWSPDGRSISFSSDPAAPPYVFIMPAGGGPQQAVTKPGDVQTPTDWLRDGRIFYNQETNQGSDIMLARPGGAPEAWLKTPADEGDARVSRSALGRLRVEGHRPWADLRRAAGSPRCSRTGLDQWRTDPGVESRWK